jgi:positive regulator of sigma E activity
MTWALSTALFLYLGTWVDRWVGTETLFALLGAFIGAAAGFYYMYHHLVTEPRERGAGKPRDERK